MRTWGEEAPSRQCAIASARDAPPHALKLVNIARQQAATEENAVATLKVQRGREGCVMIFSSGNREKPPSGSGNEGVGFGRRRIVAVL